MSSAPITMEWNGEAMVPASPYWSGRADCQFVVGEIYNIVEHHDRSKASHNHYFVSLSNAWETLPDDLLEIYPTAEHLRKKALIRKGYCNERDIVLSTKADAKSIARELQHLDTYAIIEARECVIRIREAKSQSMKAMPNGEFQKSKQDVLDFVAGLIGVTTEELARSAA